MTAPPRSRALALVSRNREAILRIAREHGAFDVRVFGSAARGEDGPASDLDILVKVERGRSMLDVIRLQLALDDLLGVRTDVVEEQALHPLIREAVLHQAVAV